MIRALLLLILVCVSSEAATITAASTSRTDVNTAYGLTSTGDILEIPAGSSTTWSSPITIARSITVKGQGTNSTILNSTGSGFFIVSEVYNGVRFTQIQFAKSARSGSGNDGEIRVASSSGVTKGFRIDHCYFKNGQYSFRPNSDSTVYGVIDHNHFYNCDAPMNLLGGNDDTWATRKHTGTTNTMVFEDNLHTVNDLADNISGWTDQEQFIEGEGMDFVIRHCVFEMASLTEYNGIAIEWHGNHEIWDNSGTKRRGPQLIEIYSNIFNINFTYRTIHARGGSFLCYSNKATYSTANQVWVQMEEEEGQSGGVTGGGPVKTIWAAEDQINNTHIWQNTLTGSGITVVTTNYSTDSIFIQKGRDWFDAAPDNTSGYTDWGAARLGSSNMVHTASGTQWHYPLTQLTYPHPLVTAQDGGGGTAPASPSSLSASAVSTSQIDLSWTDNASDEDGFEVDRALDSGFTSSLVTTGGIAANATSYNSTGLSASTTYYYRVRATNAFGASSYSSSANSTTHAAASGAGNTGVKIRGVRNRR